LISAGVFVICLILGARLFSLQVTAFERYNSLATGNRVRETITFAPRGRILDRQGRILADNKLSFQLSATPYLLAEDQTERQDDYEVIAQMLNVSVAELAAASETEGLDYPLPITVLSNIEHRRALALMQYLPRLEGFQLLEVPIRQYVSDSGLAHILGYTGGISELELASQPDSGLLPIDIVGKTGIEKQYDDVLRGQNGLQRTEVDTLGRPVRLLAQQEALLGQDITLTIDLDIQRRLASELAKQMKNAKVQRASAVALDPNNGEILAMVSLPYYDNNLFANGISTEDFNRLVNDPNQPLLNKAVSAGYTTGSVIKPIVASAALQEKVITPQTIINDNGFIAVTSVYQPGASFIFRGWRPEGLGPMNVRRAIAMSSNIYFYTVGGGHGGISGLGVDRLTGYYREFGLGEATGIDLPGETSGRVPDRNWKLAEKGEPWYIGDTYNISIGQGDLIVSPLQLTLADMAVANGGDVLRPQLLLRIGDEMVARKQVRRTVGVDPANLQIVREGMREVITNGTTCACRFANVPVDVAGKSGTAETNTPDGRRPHAWYTAFAPFQDPQIMVTAMLEEGSGGSTYAAPVTAAAMEAFFQP
jgi:penicillin-binding protein 2